MTRYFDASALAKRYVRETGSTTVRRLLASGVAATSRLSEVEVASAIVSSRSGRGVLPRPTRSYAGRLQRRCACTRGGGADPSHHRPRAIPAAAAPAAGRGRRATGELLVPAAPAGAAGPVRRLRSASGVGRSRGGTDRDRRSARRTAGSRQRSWASRSEPASATFPFPVSCRRVPELTPEPLRGLAVSGAVTSARRPMLSCRLARACERPVGLRTGLFGPRASDTNDAPASFKCATCDTMSR